MVGPHDVTTSSVVSIYQNFNLYYVTQEVQLENLKTSLVKDCSETLIDTKINCDCKNASWSDCKHHNTAEFLVCVFTNTTITLSKVYTKRTSDFGISTNTSA